MLLFSVSVCWLLFTTDSPPRPLLGPELESSFRDAQVLVNISHSLAPTNEQGHPPALTAIIYHLIDRSTSITRFFYKVRKLFFTYVSIHTHCSVYERWHDLCYSCTMAARGLRGVREWRRYIELETTRAEPEWV